MCVALRCPPSRFRRPVLKRIRQSFPLEGNHNKVDEKIIESPYHTSLVASTDALRILLRFARNAWRAFARWYKNEPWKKKERGKRPRGRGGDGGREEEGKEINRTVPSQRQWVINGIVLWISSRACEFAFPRQRRRDPKQSLRACVPACLHACVYVRDGETPRKLASRASPLTSCTHALSSGSSMWIFFRAQCIRSG